MTNSQKPSALFWVIGIIALLWNGMGANSYIQQAYNTEASTAGLNQEQIDMLQNMPAWYTALFAIAVFAGVIAAITFLMKKKIAVTLFMVSFLAALINQIYWLFGTNAVEVFSEMQPYLWPILIIVLGLIFIWFSKKQKDNGVLR